MAVLEIAAQVLRDEAEDVLDLTKKLNGQLLEAVCLIDE